MRIVEQPKASRTFLATSKPTEEYAEKPELARFAVSVGASGPVRKDRMSEFVVRNKSDFTLLIEGRRPAILTLVARTSSVLKDATAIR